MSGRGRVLAVVAAVLFVLSAAAAYVVLASQSPTLFGALAASFAQDLAVLVLVAAIVLGFALWKKRWIAAALAVLSAIFSGLAAFVPVSAALTAASSSGVRVS